MSSDHTIHPLDELAVYALDALEGHERRIVESHLTGCGACRAELDQHRTTLAHLATPDAPPPELWDRIARQTTAVPRLRAGGTSGNGDDEHEPRHRAPPRGSGQRRWLGVLAAAAAVVVVAGVAVWGLRPSDSADTVADLAAEAADDPDATVVALTAGTGEARARVVTTGDQADYLLLDDLPRLPRGRAYQLWRVDDPDTPVSLGVVGDGSSPAAAVSVPDGTTAFALSDEPATGSVRPTTIVASGTTS